MPLPQAKAERVFISTLGYLRGRAADKSELGATRAAVAHGRESGETYNFSEYRQIVRRAHAAWSEGIQTQLLGYVPTSGDRLPIDPTATPGSGLYRYRVVVEVREGTTIVASTAVNVDSPVILPPNQVGFEAVQVARGDLPGRDYRSNVAGYNPLLSEFQTTIISVGRAGP